MKVQGVDEEGEEGVVFIAEGLCGMLRGLPTALTSWSETALPFYECDARGCNVKS